MLIKTTNGSQYEAHNIAWMLAKALPSGDWELEIHPAQGSLLEPAGASFAEVPVPHDEAVRIARVARHLFAPGVARAIDGEACDAG